MATEQKQKQNRRGRPVTPYKHNLMVRVSKEAIEKIQGVQNRSEVIDRLIMEHL
jgi:hypothetical protein